MSQSTVPPLVKFTGVLPVAQGPVVVTFSLYAEPAGGESLWSETQAVSPDATGRYSVLLGATQDAGLPLSLFATGAPRWVGVRVGDLELPRVLLTSTPYALKAGDAETIAGRPLSAFVLAGETTGVGADGLTYVNPRTIGAALGGAFAPTATAGTPNYIGMFTSATDVGNSVMYQNGTAIGVNTTTPEAALHVRGTMAPAAYFELYTNLLTALPAVYRVARGTPASPAAVQAGDILGGLAVRGYGSTQFGGGVGQVMFRAAETFTDTARGTFLQVTTTPIGSANWQERMRIDPSGNVGIGTPSPAQKLSVAGTIESLTGGFKFPDGTIQTTAGSGGGTYSAGAGLSLASNVFSVNFAGSGSASMAARSDHGHAGYATLAVNTFTGTQTISSGGLVLPSTTASTSGVVTLGGNPFLHAAGAPSNVFVGTNAGGGFAVTTGTGNVGVGFRALYANTAGTSNTAVGTNALYSTTDGYSNTALGDEALNANVSGVGNTAVGARALRSNTTHGNTAVGNDALKASTTGDGNTAIGNAAMAAQTTATDNTAVGFFSLNKTTVGWNTAVGSNSLLANTTGASNTAIGRDAMIGNESGDYNSGLGAWALRHLVGGNYNTGVGVNAGYNLTGGSYNTFIGWLAEADATTPGLQYATAIGAHAVVAASNAMALGGTGTAAVNVGIATSTPDERLHVVGDIKVGTAGSNGCLKNYAGGAIAGTCSSDIRLKANVRPFDRVLDRVGRLQPVHYDWKIAQFPSYHFGAGTQSGLVAQDVEQVFPELVATDEHGYKMVNYSEVPLLTLAAVRELKAENDALRAELAALKAVVEALRQSPR